MVIMGNPPYSVSSTNKSPWIEKLTADYKKDMKERNIQPLSDDYIKFIRFGEHFINKNGEGVLAYISNNSFIDGLIHRQMRRHLLESFDKIYILDLHGNSKKKEVSPDGSIDQNVFDIMQGVSISFFIKRTSEVNKQGQIFHADLFGRRSEKYQFLIENTLKTITWNKLNNELPNLFFVKKDFKELNQFEIGFKVNELFKLNASGIKTERDNVTIQFSEQILEAIEKDILNLEIEEFRKKHSPKPDGRDWKISTAKDDLKKNVSIKSNVLYRPFDVRKTIYTGKSKGFHSYPRGEIMKHLLKPNIALVFERSVTIGQFTNIFVSNNLVECHALGTAFSFGYTAPLYIYPNTNIQQNLLNQGIRTPNLDKELVDKIASGLGLTFVSEKAETILSEVDDTFAPIDILDYIYAVLHSPSYREKYREFLKIDFPRVPYPSDVTIFWKLVKLGGEIRKIHLLASPEVENYITQYPEDGDNVVDKLSFTVISNEERGEISKVEEIDHTIEVDISAYENDKLGRVYINKTQYFDNVPEVAWTFYIGGYQPAQKWLKDRKGRELSLKIFYIIKR